MPSFTFTFPDACHLRHGSTKLPPIVIVYGAGRPQR